MSFVTSFDLEIGYTQIVVCDSEHADAFNDWSDQHVAQGFAWRTGNVSFGTVGHGSECFVEVRQDTEVNLKEKTQRAILVPFIVSSSETVFVDSLGGGEPEEVQLPAGNYALVFETGFREELREEPEYQDDPYWLPMWCCLTFVPQDSVRAEILRADSDLNPSYPLLMEARSVAE